MSGIAVAVTRGDRNVDVSAMLATMPHRGATTATSTLVRVAIGAVSSDNACRASVFSTNGRAAALGGSLDNALELARRFGVADESSPAEILVAMARASGDVKSIASAMRGAYAAILTDGETVWAFRDHVGHVPLFWIETAAGVFLGSEPKAVIQGAGIRREPDLEIVERTFFGTIADDDRCAMLGVRRIPVASMLVAKSTGCQLRRYWSPESVLESAVLSPLEVHERFDHLMEQAVTRTLTGNDVVSFSGGIDSPAVAAYAAPRYFEATGRPLAALSTIYPDHPSVDEREFIEPAAEEIGLSPLHMYSDSVGPLYQIERWVERFDGPVAAVSISETALHLEKARSLGYASMLTGEFAEFVVDDRTNLLEHLISHGHLRTAARHLRSQVAAGAPVGRGLRAVARAFIPAALLRLRQQWRPTERRVPAWIDSSRLVPRVAQSSRHGWRTAQLAGFSGPGLSMEADSYIQQHVGVQIRRPFADVDLWEFFLSLPAHQKFPDHGRKVLFRQLLRGKVPDLILDRRTKTVFNESILSGIDYAELRRLIFDTPHRITGVDYSMLKGHLDREDLDIIGFMWAKDLAAIHAFLALW